MILALVSNVLALFFSGFVVGTLLGVALSKPFRKQVTQFIARWSSDELVRCDQNPILRPGAHPWTAEAVMNPAAVRVGGRTHLIYRAIGMDGVSRLGYASSADGFVFDERLPNPIYVARSPGGTRHPEHRYSPVMYPSGGSWGGCEDPRMVAIDERVYVTLNMFENWEMRVAYISISEEDFIAKQFGRWDGPYIISHTNREKNWTLFPEKINGQFAVLHGIIDEDENRVRVEYTDDLRTFSQKKFETIDPQRVPNRQIAWHVHMRSAGPPPIKTDKGWLVFYHAHDALQGDRYKLGAMLLDLEDPTRIICRSAHPVLEPDEWYENAGKPGVIYACGAVVEGDTLHIYYGGADKVICVATANLNNFLHALLSGEQAALTTQAVQTT